jgi:hypothetical protein
MANKKNDHSRKNRKNSKKQNAKQPKRRSVMKTKTLYENMDNTNFAFRKTIKERLMSFAERILVSIIMLPMSLLISIWLIWLCAR